MSEAQTEAVAQIVSAIVWSAARRGSRTAKPRPRHWIFDSLERAELLLRLERAFQVRLPDSSLGAQTVGDSWRLWKAATRRFAARGVRPALPTVASPAAARSLIDVLRFHAENNGDRLHLTWLRGDGDEVPLRYGELWDKARGPHPSCSRPACAPATGWREASHLAGILLCLLRLALAGRRRSAA